MSSAAKWLLTAAAWPWLLISVPVSAVVVDQILAVVNGHLITQNDLQIQSTFGLEFPLLEDPGKNVHLQFAVDQVLLLEDAEKFATEKPKEEDIEAQLRKIEADAGSPDRLNSQLYDLGISRDELKGWVGRYLLAKTFIEQRINYFIFVSDNEIRSYFDEHPDEWQGTPLEANRNRIYALLFENKRKAKLGEFLLKRRAKAIIRINPPVDATAQ
jgi:hypothetical protein